MSIFKFFKKSKEKKAKKKKVKVKKLIRKTAGGRHGLYESNVGIIRKPLGIFKK